MKIIFKTENEEPTFNQVGIDQFFVDFRGALCQKSTYSRYNTIANKEGKLSSDTFEGVDKEEVIERILPKVKEIEF